LGKLFALLTLFRDRVAILRSVSLRGGCMPSASGLEDIAGQFGLNRATHAAKLPLN